MPSSAWTSSNTAVDAARQANPKTKFNTKRFQQCLRSARRGSERLHGLIFAKHPAVLDLGCCTVSGMPYTICHFGRCSPSPPPWGRDFPENRFRALPPLNRVGADVRRL